MASNAAALRDAELASYAPAQLVELLRTTHRAADFDAVTRVLEARESRAAQAEAELQTTLDDALRRVQDQAEEDSARLRRIAEEEARALLRAAMSEINEAGKKKQDEMSAHLAAVLAELQALRKRQGEDLSATVEMIMEVTEAKLKASFSKIYASLKKPNREAVSIQEMHAEIADTALAVARQIGQQVVEGDNQGRRDGSGGMTLKRKADALENRAVSPVQISEEGLEAMEVPPGFSPTPRFSKDLASAEGSGKTLTEPTPLEKKGEVAEPNAPSEEDDVHTPPTATPTASQGQQGRIQRPKRVPKPNRKYADTDVRAIVSKRSRGCRPTVRKEKSKNVSRDSVSLGIGRGRGKSNTSVNMSLCARSFNRPSPMCKAPPRTSHEEGDVGSSGNAGLEVSDQSYHLGKDLSQVKTKEQDQGAKDWV